MRNTILIAEDAELSRKMLVDLLKDEYNILEAVNGQEALDILEQQDIEIAAILLDLIMPVMDGFETLKILNEKNIIGKVPVLVISARSSIQNEERCFEYGISDFIGKPFNANLVKKRVRNAVENYVYKNELEKKVDEQTKVLKQAYQMLKEQADQLLGVNQEIIDVLGTVVEYRNLESGEHIQRVKGYTRILAEALMKEYPEYGLTDSKIEDIVSVSSLHDIGKITIPDGILLKPGKLTKEEFEKMKLHTVKGCDILDSIDGVWDNDTKNLAYEICRHHHERYDGKGYPDGLKGEEIPISAQIVSIADVYDALVNERCYKAAYTTEQAFNMINNGECGTFSPKIINAFCNAREQFEELANS